MAKELPYFQFEPGEYLTGNIQFCSLESQGLFINIQSIYWQRECNFTLEQLQRKFNYPKLVEELIKENIIKIDKKNNIQIDFLNKQFIQISDKKKLLSDYGKKGAEIKRQATLKPPIKPPLSNKIREDKIREDKINIISTNELSNEILNFFGFTELSNPNLLFKINNFILNIVSEKRFTVFTEQWKYYKLYQTATNKKAIHKAENFINEGWNGELWSLKYNALNIEEKPKERKVCR